MSVLAELAAAAGGHAAAAGPGDAVGGVPARYVAAPGSTAEVAAVLRVAAARDLAVVARGAGTKLGWGAPPRRLDLIVDTGRLDQVVEHAAGDLVVTVRAGVPLAALADRLAPAGQRLAVDEVVPGTTVGGMLATGLSGPRRLLAGAVRDLVLGVTLVRADGVVARAGGKVVKNVAGYDVAKLVTGAYGTLGLVTEATFRLHPVAPATAYVSAVFPDAAAAGAAVLRVLHAQFVPSALEVDRPAPDGPVEVALLLEGTPAGVAARTERAAATLGGTRTDRPAWWGRLPVPTPTGPTPTGPARTGSAPTGPTPATRDPAGAAPAGPAPAGPTPAGPTPAGGEPVGGGGVLVKVTAELSGLAALLDGVRRAAGGLPVAVRGSAGVGAFHAALPGDDPAAVGRVVTALRAAAPAWGGSVVVLAGPAGPGVDRWGPVPGLELMRAVKDRFDPAALLAPGRFVGGI